MARHGSIILRNVQAGTYLLIAVETTVKRRFCVACGFARKGVFSI